MGFPHVNRLLARPLADTRTAALRLALALMFVLSPATRFGYFAYPAALCGWIVLSRPQEAAEKITRIRLPA